MSREEALCEAALLAFCEPPHQKSESLRHLSAGEWGRLLCWLDTSGLALYFLERLESLDICELLPGAVLARLQQNLADNTRRTSELIAESAEVQCQFQEAKISYAVMKGLSLWPLSVPDLALRSQLDLDFLVAESSASEAQRILEGRGYRLKAISGKTYEFVAQEHLTASLKDLYKPGLSRSVELHIEHAGGERASLLSRREVRTLAGVSVPVLAPLDLFVGQGLHLYKHVCSEFLRTAHVLEFRRHVVARYSDETFWRTLREHTSWDRTIGVRLGLVTLLISHVMGDFAPECFTQWTVDQLPAAAAPWARRYGRRVVLSSFPGSKLYLILQAEMEVAGLPAKRSRLRSLVPLRPPPLIAGGIQGEGPAARVQRYRRQLRFTFFRLRFHFVEGVRYFGESLRWRQYRNGPAR